MATISEALAIAVQHHQAGRLQAAEQIYRQILALQPDHADALHLLGVIAYQAGKHEAAVQYIERAIRLKGAEAAFHSDLGNALGGQGKLDEAVACYRRALELNPGYVEAHNNLGNALEDQGKPDEAVACYRRALELKPDFAEAHNNLGIALKNQGKFEEAVACYRRALQRKPDFAEAHSNLGFALQDLGKVDEAVACYRRALELKPEFAEAQNNLASAFTCQGKLDEAVACYRQVVQRASGGVLGLGEALGQLATILRSRLPEDDLLLMRRLLSDPNLGDEGRAALEFGLAQVHDARGDYRQAAERLGQSNAARLAALKKRKREYRPLKYRSFISSMIAAFTPQFFARASGFGLETELPVFIVGLPRSGTTLVEQILASHRLVFGAGELRYCDETFQSLPKAVNRSDPPLQCLPDLDRETTRRLAQRHVDRLRALDQRALRIVDKMPENYQCLGLVRVLFPQARLIHCRRDLRDVALSCWTTNFASMPWTCDPDHLISHFEEYARLMDHWRKVLPSPPLDVDYEELVEDTEAVARRVVAWCGLDWEPGCLRFYETQRPVRTASAIQVRRPVYKSSVGRWKNYQESLGELFSRAHRLDGTQIEGR
jgi:tetratricopeptide (TPR) repeat protein